MSIIHRLRHAYRLQAGRRRNEPRRITQIYPKLLGMFGRQNKLLGTSGRPNPSNLRAFARTPYARQAINSIKNPIAGLKWELKLADESAYTKKRADTLLACFRQPNNADTFRSFIEQITEDLLQIGEGYIEHANGADEFRPLWMWPVDATTMQPLPEWDGKASSDRFAQSSNTFQGSMLSSVDTRRYKAADICFMRMNPTTDNPNGLGPLEVAYDSIQQKLGVGRYAANVASNAQPQNLIYGGEMTPEQVNTFRGYWNDEVEGQGTTPVIGGKTKPEVIRLHAGGDEALYLKWQEFLIREIATAFGISAMNLNLERDVNRNTAEVGHDRDFAAAVVPLARLIEEHINIDIIQRRMGLAGVEFAFIGLDREDEEASANIFKTLYEANAVVPDEWREEHGMKPMESPWGRMTSADVLIAIKAAQGASQVDDPALTQGQPAASKPSRSKAKQKSSGKQSGDTK